MSVSTAQQPFTRRVARPGRAAMIVTLIAALAAAGCSSSGSKSDKSSGAAPTGGGGGGASSNAVATATKLLDQAKSAVTGPSVGAVTASQIVPWTAASMPQPVALPRRRSRSTSCTASPSVKVPTSPS